MRFGVIRKRGNRFRQQKGQNVEIIQKNPADLTPYENNTKTHPPEQVDRIAESIRRFGWQQPIVVDRDNVVIIGHGRLMAAKQLMLDSVPVVYADNLTEEEAQALRLADNKTNESPWDFGKLEEELAALSIAGIDMTAFGFDDLEAQMDAPEVQEVETPEVPEEPKAKRGEIYRLGEHRLMCGDSASPEDVQKLTDGTKAALLLTDPPYGIKADKGFSGAGGFDGKGKPIERRHYQDDWDAERPGAECFENICKAANKAIVFGGNFFADILPVGNHWLVWNKHNTMPTFSDAELAWTNIKRNSVKLYDVEWNGLIGKEKERFHPTQKPVKLFSDILNDYTEHGEIVFDFFGGAGTTLVACEQTGRKCFMMELDPHYVDVIIQRWETLTGEKAVLLNDP